MILAGELMVQPRRFPTSWESQQLQKVRRSSRTIFKVANMSAPMISWAPIVNRIHRYLTTSDYTSQSINLESVEIHDVETAPEKRPRTLKHLLRANHVNHAIIYHHLQYHNHMPHLLGSAYLLGADVAQLQKIYDTESKELEEWQDSPAEICDADWRDFLGDKKYQRAYVDFFEDELALKFNYDWSKVAEEYLFSGKNPLINGVIAGLGHPLIHLGYAYELSSKEVGMEALAMSCTAYNFLHKYIDEPTYTRESTYTTTSPLEIIHKIHNDKRFDGLFQGHGDKNIQDLFFNHESLVLEHWNAWKISDPKKQFEESQEAAVALVVRTVKPGTHAYDFFMVHILTTSHAVRILLPIIPKRFHISLVRQWWLLTIAVYIAQLRPKIDDDIEVKPGKQWNYVDLMAVNGPWSTDAHYVKALRAMKQAAFTWGDVHERYLAAAVHFADDFKGWTGFGFAEEEEDV
ncbi:hypothetical protein B0J14DRAFT_596663 [Halenospora varia]|nr:hypothetical protein B0J14DRAFT_596663 [Halenospora varia]